MPKLLLAAILATVAVAAEPATLALTHVAVIDGDGTRAQPDLTVLIGGNRIASMGKKVRVPPGASSGPDSPAPGVEHRGEYEDGSALQR